jgi:hypothetical protein
MALPLPAEPAPNLMSIWCPGGGQPPAGVADHTLRFVYGGGCAACRLPVSVDDTWMTRPHHTREFLHNGR